ncbi:hypothetical protein FRC04_006573 [Tulasnella sp. 424]|nr:hypothetical protein FRC04_006573 [Tulasnella sp. 424]
MLVPSQSRAPGPPACSNQEMKEVRPTFTPRQEFAQRPQYAQFGSTFSLLHAACRWFMSKKRCAKHNRILDVRASLVIRNLYDGVDEGEEEDPKNQDPEPDRENGMEMSRVPFSDLVKDFPNSYQSMESSIWRRSML